MKPQLKVKPLAAIVGKAVQAIMVPAILALPLTVSADERDGKDVAVDTSRRLEVVEVIGRNEQTTFATETFSATKFKTHVLDIGQSISVITKELIQDQGLVRLNDITPYVAGVNEFSVYNDVTIRGFRNYDDRRVNGLRTYNDFWSQDVIAHVERVEVIKGPAAVTFGDASPGGVVNMVTKKPLEEYRHEIAARAGSFSEKYLAFDTTGPLNDKLFYRLNVAREDSDSFRDAIFNENTIVAPSVTLLPFEKTRLNVDYVYIDSEGILDRGQPNIQNSQSLGTIPIEVSLTQPGDILANESKSLTISLDQQLTDAWSFALAHNIFDYSQKLLEHGFSSYVIGSDSQVNLYYTDRNSSADLSSTSAYFTGVFETGGLSHKLLVGLDVLDSKNIAAQLSANNIATVNLLAPENFRRDIASYELTDYSSWGGASKSTGLYVQDQMEFGPWQLTLGLRHDEFEITTLGSSIKTDDNQVSPRASALYRLDENSSVYSSWIKGFQPPGPDINGEINGGPFDPEKSELWEIGYKAMLMEGNALFVASIYQLTKQDSIVYANDEDNDELYLQRGEERSRGLELEFTGNVTDKLLLIANYAYTDAEIVEDSDPEKNGKPKEGAPKHTATLWGKYDLTEQFGFAAGVEYVGERYTFVDTLQLPSYTLYNASVFYDPTPNLQFALQGKNLSDETHWTGGYNYQRLYPGNPRSLSLNINYQF